MPYAVGRIILLWSYLKGLIHDINLFYHKILWQQRSLHKTKQSHCHQIHSWNCSPWRANLSQIFEVLYSCSMTKYTKHSCNVSCKMLTSQSLPTYFLNYFN